MMNKHLHNIHFILSILGSLKHMEHCNEYSTHIERMKRKIHTVTRYTPQLIYTMSHELFGEFLRLHGEIILYTLLFQEISSPFSIRLSERRVRCISTCKLRIHISFESHSTFLNLALLSSLFS